MKKFREIYPGNFIRSLIGGLVILCGLGLIIFPVKAFSKNDPAADFDEILIHVQLAQFGGMEIPAAIREENVFLSVTDLFDFLQIKNAMRDESIMEGFILNPKDGFILDLEQKTLFYQGQHHTLGPGILIRQEGFFYLHSDIFGEVFGLDCSFNFRSLSVTLTTKLDLPVFRLKRQEMLRKNLHRLQEEIIADTIFRRKGSMARLSMADWNITSTQQIHPVMEESANPRPLNQSRINLSLGGELAHGEVMARLNLQEGIPFQSRNQFYQWRYVNNDLALAKQFTLGRINSQSVATLYAPIVGMQISNASTQRRKSFGSYRISDYTEPEWLVELYVNNLLIDYVQADATGFFTFDVPLVYGNTAIQLKFYGPHGEEQVREKYINVPFNFLPKNELEYTVGAGVSEDGEGSVFSRGSVNYGLSNFVTVGGGLEYLSSLSDQPFMPFVQSSVRISEGLMFSGDYLPGVRTRALVNYRLPASLQLEINYTKLEEDQKAVFHNYLEERKVALSMPFRKNSFFLFSRLSLSQKIYPTTRFTTGDLLLSSMLFGVNTSLSTYGTFRGNASSTLQTQISQTYRLPAGISFMPELQYNYQEKQVSQVRARVEKRLSKRGYINAYYQNNLLYKSTSFGIGLRFDLSFGHTGIQMRQNNQQSYLTETAGGSLLYDAGTRHLEASNRGNVGKGAITVLPFLDLNANGKKDKGEILVAGLKLKVRGGQVQYDKMGEAIRITNLMAYEDYFLELDKSSFDNITWRIQDPVIKVSVTPNQFRQVEVPVLVMGEIAGMVYLEEEFNGMGRITINYYNERNELIHSVLSESDGYFTYMGLAPGKYTVMPDSAQLAQLGYSYKANKNTIIIESNREGDYVDDLEFILHKNKREPIASDSLNTSTSQDQQEVTAEKEEREQGLAQVRESAPLEERKVQRFTLIHTNPALLAILKNKSLEEQRQIIKSRRENTEIQKDATLSGIETGKDSLSLEQEAVYAVQVLASELKVPLDHDYFKRISPVSEEFQEGYYKYTVQSSSSYEEVLDALERLRGQGFGDAFIVKYLGGKRLGAGSGSNPVDAERIKQRTHPDTYFRIQILASERMLDLEDSVFRGIGGIDYYFHKERHKYTYGVALEYEEAVVLLHQVREMGFKDAFIVSFYKRRRLE